MSTFEQIGFIKEFYVGRKYIGSIRLEESDRGKSFGYDGRKSEITNVVIVTDNKKKIKSGAEVMTIVYPMNGKWNRD